MLPTQPSAGKPKNSTRQKLVDAAHALIWANSYALVSVADICAHAGVQKGSFYHFFPTKHDLAAAALEDHWQQMRPRLEAIFSANKTARKQLRALCQEILHKQREAFDASGVVCGCPYATVASEISSQDESLRNLSVTMNERYQGYFERLLRTAADEKLIPAKNLTARAREMHIFVIGAMMQARITNNLACLGAPLESALLGISGMKR